jgi:putative transposase
MIKEAGSFFQDET